jgi:hypothetical protein
MKDILTATCRPKAILRAIYNLEGQKTGMVSFLSSNKVGQSDSISVKRQVQGKHHMILFLLCEHKLITVQITMPSIEMIGIARTTQ